jgi:hypothetical protein
MYIYILTVLSRVLGQAATAMISFQGLLHNLHNLHNLGSVRGHVLPRASQFANVVSISRVWRESPA